jgi:hypothetical protein
MNVNTATKGVGVLAFQSTQPNDARNHRIATRSIWCKNFSGESPVVKNSAGRCVVTDFFRDRKVTKRSCHSSPKIAQSKLGCGNGVGCHSCAVLEQHQLLIADAYYQLMGRLELRCEKGWSK